ncbi:MAG: monofunctional biosynthetic peptidoglycan transglycosylase, partial [Cyanobacteria bacterium P01_F01_bin.53]
MYRKPRHRRRLNLRRLLWRLASLFVWLWALSAVLVLLLRFVPPITTSFMLQTSLRNGFYTYKWKPYEQISPNMALAA